MYCEDSKGKRVDLSSKEYASCAGGVCGGWRYVASGCAPWNKSCGGRAGAWLPAAEVCRLNLYAKFEKRAAASSSSTGSSSSSIQPPTIRAIAAGQSGGCPTDCPSGCCPEENWFCCPDGLHCAATEADCPGSSSVTSDPLVLFGTTVTPSDYFDPTLPPMSLYTAPTGSNLVVPEWYGYNTAVYVNSSGTTTEDPVVPGNILTFKSAILLGYDPTKSQAPGLLAPPEFTVAQVGNVETGSVTQVNVTPVDGATGYVFRFNGVALKPDRIGPASGSPEGYPDLEEGQYQYLTSFDGQAMTAASVNSEGTGAFSEPTQIGNKPCDVDGDCTDPYCCVGGECIDCSKTGSWCVGQLACDSLFYISGCAAGTFKEWRDSNIANAAQNFQEGGSCESASCPKEEAPECCGSGDCKDCEQCVEGKCVSDCSEGQKCCPDFGYCCGPTDSCCNGECCPANQCCEGGVCTECPCGGGQACPEGTSCCAGYCKSGKCCETNSDCGECEVCGFNQCTPCPPEKCCGGVCQSGTCCSSDSDCESCEKCVNGVCEPIQCDASKCEKCVEGECVGCDASTCEKCLDGKCYPLPGYGCCTNDDCESCEECFDNTCISTCDSCEACDENNQCSPKCPPDKVCGPFEQCLSTTNCSESGDCPEGHYCCQGVFGGKNICQPIPCCGSGQFYTDCGEPNCVDYCKSGVFGEEFYDTETCSCSCRPAFVDCAGRAALVWNQEKCNCVCSNGLTQKDCLDRGLPFKNGIKEGETECGCDCDYAPGRTSCPPAAWDGTLCNCDCPRAYEPCPSPLVFDGMCRCACPYETYCDESQGFIWNPGTCECDKVCPSGTAYRCGDTDPSTIGCGECSGGQYLGACGEANDEGTAVPGFRPCKTCALSPSDCSAGTQFNAVKCRCEPVCAEGQHLDEDTLECYCPLGGYWDGSSCSSCEGNKVVNSSEDGCECPNPQTKYWDERAKSCIFCPLLEPVFAGNYQDGEPRYFDDYCQSINATLLFDGNHCECVGTSSSSSICTLDFNMPWYDPCVEAGWDLLDEDKCECACGPGKIYNGYMCADVEQPSSSSSGMSFRLHAMPASDSPMAGGNCADCQWPNECLPDGTCCPWGRTCWPNCCPEGYQCENGDTCVLYGPKPRI